MSDRRLRIVAWGVLPPPVHGHSVMNETTRALMERDHDVTWFNPTASSRIEELEQVSVHKVLVGVATMARFALALVPTSRVDVAYISPSRSGAPLIRDTLVWAIAARACPRVVVHLHTGELGFLRSPGWLGRIQRRLLRSSEVWAQTAAWAAEVSYLGARQVKVIPNGVSCGRLHAPWTRLVPRTGPLHLVYIGNLAYEKGIDVFVDTVTGMLGADHATATVAGAAFESETEKLIDPLLARHPDSIRRIRRFDSRGRCALLRSADVLVFPSRYDEAFSLVVCEAMEHGVVPVVSRRGALPSLVDTAGFCCDEPGEYASVIERLYDDRELLEKHSDAATIRWREQFSRECYFERIAAAL